MPADEQCPSGPAVLTFVETAVANLHTTGLAYVAHALQTTLFPFIVNNFPLASISSSASSDAVWTPAGTPASERSVSLLRSSPEATPGLRRRGGAVDKSTTAPLCAGCGKQLTEVDLAAPVRQPGGALRECDCCHRCFHDPCHRRWAAERHRQDPSQPNQQQPSRQRGPRRWLVWWSRGGRADGSGGGCAAPPDDHAGGTPAGAGRNPGRDGSGAVEDEEGGWFHTRECWQVHRSLQRLCRAGATPCPAGATSAKPPDNSTLDRPGTAADSLANGGEGSTCGSSSGGGGAPGELAVRLYDCRRTGPGAAAGLRRVYGVLRQEFGYSLADCRQFDYAALLTADQSAVSAALLDVYGSDLAELYVMATCTALQRRGYGTALVRHLERSLGSAGIRRLLVSVDDDDEANQGFWRDKLGFQLLEAAELEQLGRSFGAFGPAAANGTVFLSRPLELPPTSLAIRKSGC